MAATALYSSNVASAKHLSSAKRLSDISKTNSVKNINDPAKKDEAGEKSGFDLVDELTQNLVNAFQNNEVIPSYEPETMFGSCTACGSDIEDQANVVNGQHYHPACFTCDECNQPLGDEKYFILQGKSCCKICKDKYLETCTKCGKKIEENTIRTKGSNDAYHPDCFVCHTCGSVLHGKFFKTDDGNHLCESDFMDTREKCFRCGRAVMELSLKALNNIYHPDCFMCSLCPKRLDGEVFYFSSETKQPLCKEDYERYEAKTCNTCSGKIIEEKFISTNTDKYYHQDCYNIN